MLFKLFFLKFLQPIITRCGVHGWIRSGIYIIVTILIHILEYLTQRFEENNASSAKITQTLMDDQNIKNDLIFIKKNTTDF